MIILVICSFLIIASNAELRFITIGDWGIINKHQSDVAYQLSQTARNMKPGFIISLGDNFYEDGIANVTDPQWKQKFEDVYNADSLMVPWYLVLGNHDWDGNSSAEILYSKLDPKHRWNMPDHFFIKQFSISTTNLTAEFVFIDTIMLDYDYPERSKWISWVDTTLKASVSTWLFVVGHYTIVTGGEHGPTQSLVNDLVPLMRKYKVDAYICGHDHTLQHLRQDNLSYFVSGNGAKDQGTLNPIPQTLFNTTRNGFMTHVISTASPFPMIVSIVDETGKSLYSYTQYPIPKKNSSEEIPIAIM